MRDIVYIGVGGHAVAIDRTTGHEVWRTKLKGSDFVNVSVEGRDLLAATKGQLFCLDAGTGTLRWQNELKGLGWGLVTIAGAGAAAPAEAERRRQAAAATAAM